jgi:hypothetical protein
MHVPPAAEEAAAASALAAKISMKKLNWKCKFGHFNSARTTSTQAAAHAIRGKGAFTVKGHV